MNRMSIDGASAGDPGPSGIGILLVYDDGQTEEFRYHIGLLNNHEAEFEAFIIALTIAKHKQLGHLLVQTDSRLVSEAIEKRYVKRKQFDPYVKKAQELIEAFDLFFIKWVPSKQNKKADELARLAIREPKRIFKEAL
ncbi:MULTISPECIES: ribonuclease HI family protein [Shouchella]|uniref:Ribonuclease HI family protein n=2 Tax=Shouchella TaxID=2893057 RepID=A0ABY7W5X2_9BACI|nr:MULTISPECIES: ribonuclease HI family protein [Shouchella]MED4126991.1 ribonuclease HI family protein [Shouchella miscanthi]WDF03481.1 ribonuclease HI family protein [Shouchella hunanensis]GAF23900.1 RNase H [Bacillus sp. JCM 19047]